MSRTGSLVFRPHAAKLTINTETFGKMDPYVIAKLGGTQLQSEVARDQGQTPTWTEGLRFPCKGEPTLEVAVWDKDRTSKDELLGTVSIPLEEVYNRRNVVDARELKAKDGKSAGTLNYQIEFTADAAAPGWGPNSNTGAASATWGASGQAQVNPWGASGQSQAQPQANPWGAPAQNNAWGAANTGPAWRPPIMPIDRPLGGDPATWGPNNQPSGQTPIGGNTAAWGPNNQPSGQTPIGGNTAAWGPNNQAAGSATIGPIGGNPATWGPNNQPNRPGPVGPIGGNPATWGPGNQSSGSTSFTPVGGDPNTWGPSGRATGAVIDPKNWGSLNTTGGFTAVGGDPSTWGPGNQAASINIPIIPVGGNPSTWGPGNQPSNSGTAVGGNSSTWGPGNQTNTKDSDPIVWGPPNYVQLGASGSAGLGSTQPGK